MSSPKTCRNSSLQALPNCQLILCLFNQRGHKFVPLTRQFILVNPSMKEKLWSKRSPQTIEDRRFRIDKRLVGGIIGLVGIIAAFAGAIDDVSMNINIAHQVDSKYPPVSLQQREQANGEIVLFAQEASKKTVQGQDPLSDLSAEKKMKLIEDIQVSNNERVRYEYRQQLLDQKPRGTLDMAVYGGGLVAILMGTSIYYVEAKSKRSKEMARLGL